MLSIQVWSAQCCPTLVQGMRVAAASARCLLAESNAPRSPTGACHCHTAPKSAALVVASCSSFTLGPSSFSPGSTVQPTAHRKH